MRGVAIHIDLKPLSTRAWRSARAHKFIVDSGCRSNAPGIRTMLVIFSSIVSVLELAAAQSFVAFTIIASRARRTRAARCLLAQHPRHTPCGGMVGLMMEKSASISSSGEFEYLLRNSFSSNELTLCSL